MEKKIFEDFYGYVDVADRRQISHQIISENFIPCRPQGRYEFSPCILCDDKGSEKSKK